jgi:hypothetical protein
MKSTVGFIESGLKGGSNNHAVDDLEQQERGGVIKSTFVHSYEYRKRVEVVSQAS